MGWKELDKDKKIFVVIGIPCFIFLILFFCTYYFEFTVFFLMIMSIFIGGFLKKDRKYLRLTKIGFFTFIIYIFMFYNITQLPNQFQRRLPGGRNKLIEPNNPNIEGLRKDFEDWHLETYNDTFDNLPEDERDDFETKMERVDYYVREIRMEYTYDINAPYYYYDHLPTIDEIFKRDLDDDGKLEDDCDGITIVTVSLLLNLGYNAWAAETEFHYFTLVFQEGDNPKTKKGFEQAVYLYNSQKHPAYLMFNEEETIIPPTQPIYLSVYDVFTGTILWESYFLGFFEGRYFSVSIFVLIPLTYVICLLLSIILTYAVKSGTSLKEVDKQKRRKQMIKIIMINSFICSFLVFLLFFVSVISFGEIGNAILIAGLIAIFRYTDPKISKLKKS